MVISLLTLAAGILLIVIGEPGRWRSCAGGALTLLGVVFLFDSFPVAARGFFASAGNSLAHWWDAAFRGGPGFSPTGFVVFVVGIGLLILGLRKVKGKNLVAVCIGAGLLLAIGALAASFPEFGTATLNLAVGLWKELVTAWKVTFSGKTF